MNHFKIDPVHTHESNSMKGKHVGVVGESHIWDGPLNQHGRLHAPGSSSGITGMQVLKYPSKYQAGPITLIAQMG